MLQRTLLFALLLSFFWSAVFSQAFNREKLDSLFDALALHHKAMGSVAVSKVGELLYTRSIGYRVVDEKIPADVYTKYRVGSISKTFTSVLVFQLIEKGKIKLTTTLDTYYPQVPNAKKITISNLLNHRSGLHNFTDEEDYLTWMTSSKTPTEMLEIICKYKVDFEPDAKFSYSNANYVLLGYIIEKLCKKTYAEVVRENITSKLGITNTYVGGKIDIKNNECYSYQYGSTWDLQSETDMSIPAGAGCIVSSPSDLNVFITGLFSGKLVSQSSIQQMKVMTDGYGMGLLPIPFYEKSGWGHTGGIDGFRSVCMYFPEDSVAVSYCSNGEVLPRNDIMVGVLSIYYGKPYMIPSFKTITLLSEDLDTYLGVYATTQMPLKITITKQQNVLMAQATGQSAFPLTAKEKDVFSFDQAGIVMEFNSNGNMLTLKQAGQTFLFTKEK